MIEPNVRVRLLGPLDRDAGRFMFSRGTTAPLPDSTSSAVRFHPEALIPSTPWREASVAEREQLVAGSARATADIVVFKIPDAVLTPLRNVLEDCGYYGTDPQAILAAPTHFAFQPALDRLVAHLAPFRIEGRPLEAFTLYRAEPGAIAVTRTDRDDPARARCVGLHVDSWEGASLRSREALRNRICVHLGRAPRSLLFVALTLPEMMRALGLPDAADHAVTLFTGHAFLRRYPDFPVTRVRLEPGEAYLAPTGMIVHDGAAPEPPEPDVALHLLGHFAAP